MRTNLIMHFHCSECGKQLKLKQENEGAKKPAYRYDDSDQDEPKEPTGAACYYTPTLSIEPCKFCIEKYTGPAKKIVEALNSLTDLGNNKD